MAVYLDDLGHLLPDPVAPDLDELHAVAQRAGLKREWFQDSSPARYPHYDAMTKRTKQGALRAGAQRITAREWMRKRKQAA